MRTASLEQLPARHRDAAARVSSAMLLGFLATLLVACGVDDDELPGTSADTSQSPAATTAAPITDILVIAVPDRMPLVGRRVLLSGVRVQTVTGDRTFWVGPDPARQLFVVLNERAMPGPDSGTVVRPGQSVMLAGVVRRLPADLTQVRSEWSLSAANLETLRREQVYLVADSVRITSR